MVPVPGVGPRTSMCNSPDHIGETIYPIYRDWLPDSGEELRDQPLFFHYRSVYPETPPEQWQTDIYIPLA